MMDRDEGERFLDWFAGFVAGEGCFSIVRHQHCRRFGCALYIHLRDDDLPILLEIQERLRMGTIHRILENKSDRNPMAALHIAKIDDILRLIEVFDSHPLRAKKQRDYQIWKEAALEISRGQRRGRASAIYNRKYLAYLAQKLKIVKGYDLSEIDEYQAEGEQLKLEFHSGEAREYPK